jgi:hypothetical protein
LKTFVAVRAATWLGVSLLGAAQVIAHPYEVNADGMSYLDAADYWLAGDWSNAINAYWSPLYSWLLAAAVALSSPATESATAHIVNFLALLVALSGADRLLVTLADDEARMNGWILAALGIAIAWSLLVLVGLTVLTPDMLLAGIALHALASFQKALDSQSSRAFLTTGLLLGVGYLAKAAMFPVALLVVGAASFHSIRRRSWRPPLLTGAGFGLIAIPFIVVLSQHTGRPTFGDSGKINYAFYIGDVPAIAHWRGGPGSSGVPVHPTQQVWSEPNAFAFAAPVGGTYPPWYGPAYWYDGVETAPSVAAHVRQVRSHAPLVASLLWPIAGALLLCIAAGGRPRDTAMKLRQHAPITVVSIAVVAMYTLVYLEERYVAGFVLSVFLAVGTSLGFSSLRKPVVVGCAILLALWPAVALFGRAERDLYAATAIARGEWTLANEHWQLAQAIRSTPFPDTSIVLIGTGARAYWARLGGFRIVAEIPDREVLAFWEQPEVTRDSILQALSRASGARLAIADEPPERFDSGRWIRVGTHGKLLRPIDPATGAAR